MFELLSMGFKQVIHTPTHRDGGIIDHLYVYQPHDLKDVMINSSLFAPFYTDHFGISVIINKGTNPFLQMPSTISDDELNAQSDRANENKAPSTSNTTKRKSSTKESRKSKR